MENKVYCISWGGAEVLLPGAKDKYCSAFG